MASSSKKRDLDPYEVLHVSQGCSEKELVKAFREGALKWHPDKNLNNKDKAHEMFLKITQAFEILSDPAVKIAYDNLQKAKQAVQERFDKLDAKRRKLREQLEAREKGSVTQQQQEAQAARNFEKEIERLRREGSKLLTKEKENIEREVHKNDAAAGSTSGSKKAPSQPAGDVHVRLRIKWKVVKGDATNGGYDRNVIESIFTKYGDVTAVAFSSKPGSAVVEFASVHSAVNAEALEQGLPDNKLTVSWRRCPADWPQRLPCLTGPHATTSTSKGCVNVPYLASSAPASFSPQFVIDYLTTMLSLAFFFSNVSFTVSYVSSAH